MERLRRRPEPAAIDITWVSCRGVRSSLLFHTPCLYASVSIVSSRAGKNVRPHRVKTATDRAGGENPEWDVPLRLYVPGASSPTPEPEAGEKKKDRSVGEGGGGGDILLVRFELKAEVAVLGDVLAASAAVPVPDLVADGRTRRVSYQLAGPDGRQRNGVISFSYAFHGTNDHDHDDHSSSDGELVVTPPPCSAACSAVALPPPPKTAVPRLYPAIEWALTEKIPIYPPAVTDTANAPVTAAELRCYPPPPPVEPAAVYPPLPETSSCSVYNPTLVEPASALYPAVDLAPVSYYPPAPPPSLYGVGYGYAAAPGWDDRCLYGHI